MPLDASALVLINAGESTTVNKVGTDGLAAIALVEILLGRTLSTLDSFRKSTPIARLDRDHVERQDTKNGPKSGRKRD